MKMKLYTRIIFVIAFLIIGFVTYKLFIYEPKNVIQYKYHAKGKDGCCNICKIGKPCGTGCIPRMAKCTLEFTCACPWKQQISPAPDSHPGNTTSYSQ